MSGCRQRKTQGSHSRTRRELPSSVPRCSLVCLVVEQAPVLSDANGWLGTEALEWTPSGGRYHASPLDIRTRLTERRHTLSTFPHHIHGMGSVKVCNLFCQLSDPVSIPGAHPMWAKFKIPCHIRWARFHLKGQRSHPRGHIGEGWAVCHSEG
ncbi:uncharacterized protein LY79DRAFT_147193 [Colletotrichum navitas]|uniref:Uncharacterized protein n=1 Tax=Colletotrichum navitas TaxID=681940 RepID=A0AAD8QDX5_9PEZI|nr:uncharacterized protein LY79DRAFT_147193 [Colletotrichum navitas]KAK1599682.1 hypothetical protein LY79DRAFT_147193 [Colletotrichum navitas]